MTCALLRRGQKISNFRNGSKRSGYRGDEFADGDDAIGRSARSSARANGAGTSAAAAGDDDSSIGARGDN